MNSKVEDKIEKFVMSSRLAACVDSHAQRIPVNHSERRDNIQQCEGGIQRAKIITVQHPSHFAPKHTIETSKI